MIRIVRRAAQLVVLTLPSFGAAQQRAPDVDTIVADLAGAETLDDEMVGDGGDKSATFRRYEQLRAIATTAQLLRLTEHAQPIVRGYALRALADRHAEGDGVDWVALLRRRVADAADVRTFSGCIVASRKLGDVAFEMVRERKLLDDEAWLDLGEALVETNSPLEARRWALRTLRFRDGRLHELRALAATDSAALIALARYRVGSDVPLLLAALRRDDAFANGDAFAAAAILPDPQLLPALADQSRKAADLAARDTPARLCGWVTAVAAQHSDAAAKLLLELLRGATTADEPRQQAVRNVLKEALSTYPGDAVFAEVRAELVRQVRR